MASLYTKNGRVSKHFKMLHNILMESHGELSGNDKISANIFRLGSFVIVFLQTNEGARFLKLSTRIFFLEITCAENHSIFLNLVFAAVRACNGASPTSAT